MSGRGQSFTIYNFAGKAVYVILCPLPDILGVDSINGRQKWSLVYYYILLAPFAKGANSILQTLIDNPCLISTAGNAAADSETFG